MSFRVFECLLIFVTIQSRYYLRILSLILNKCEGVNQFTYPKEKKINRKNGFYYGGNSKWLIRRNGSFCQ